MKLHVLFEHQLKRVGYVRDLLSKFAPNIKIGKHIGSGSEVDAFEHGHGVIKFYTYMKPLSIERATDSEFYKKITSGEYGTPVLDYGFVHKGDDVVMFWYTQPLLQELSRDEKDVVEAVMMVMNSDENWEEKKRIINRELSIVGDKFRDFLLKYIRTNADWGPSNIMKDDNGNFILADP